MADHQATDYYSSHAEQYHQTTFSIDPSSFLSPLAKLLPPHASVLDIGCGSGRDLHWLKQRGFEVTGLERSPGLARYARESACCPIIEEDFNSFDFSSISVDALLIVGGIVHVPQAEAPNLFRGFLKALRKGGLVLITTKEGSGSSRDENGREFFLWSDTELRALFNGLNLQVLDFFRNDSKLGTGEVWLGYVLKKPGQT